VHHLVLWGTPLESCKPWELSACVQRWPVIPWYAVVHCVVICHSCLTSSYPPLPSPCQCPGALARSKPRPWWWCRNPTIQSTNPHSELHWAFLFFNIQCDHRLGTPIGDVCVMTQFMILVLFYPSDHSGLCFIPLHRSIVGYLTDFFRLSSLKIEHRFGTSASVGVQSRRAGRCRVIMSQMFSGERLLLENTPTRFSFLWRLPRILTVPQGMLW